MNFEEAAAAWNEFYPHKFRVDAGTLRRHLDDPLTCYTHQTDAGLLCLKGSATPSLYPGQNPDRGHIAAWVGYGRALLDESVGMAREFGWNRLVFGMDALHLFPGIPEEMTELLALYESAGLVESHRSFDMERDLKGYVLPTECERALADSGAMVRPCRTSDEAALSNYLEEAFPGRWKYDVTSKAFVDGECGQVYLLWMDGEVVGHAMTQRDGSKNPVAGAVWRLDLGPNWGGLGSIGVSTKVRGRGLGNALLGYSLLDMSRAGVRQTIIDWTSLEAFYGAHGFRITRRYVQVALDL